MSVSGSSSTCAEESYLRAQISNLDQNIEFSIFGFARVRVRGSGLKFRPCPPRNVPWSGPYSRSKFHAFFPSPPFIAVCIRMNEDLLRGAPGYRWSRWLFQVWYDVQLPYIGFLQWRGIVFIEGSKPNRETGTGKKLRFSREVTKNTLKFSSCGTNFKTCLNLTLRTKYKIIAGNWFPEVLMPR